MTWFLELRPIRFFGFYLAVMFLLSTTMRLRQYGTILRLVRGMPARWPRLLNLVRQHANIFLTWGTVMPMLLVLVLLLLNTLASHWLWPLADQFTVERLLPLYPVWPPLVFFGMLMVGFDGYGTLVVSPIDQAQMEKYFDQAEYWLRSWTAPVVHIFTLGYVNPRKMVAIEVRNALVSASRLVSDTLWWVTVQAGLRIAFGLSLWTSYALEPWLNHVLHHPG
jgi:hypothetical protein